MGVIIRPREESEDFQGRAQDESKDSMFGFFMFGSFIRGLFLFQSIGKRKKYLVEKKKGSETSFPASGERTQSVPFRVVFGSKA